MLTPREGFDALATFLDRARPLAEQWKRGLVDHTDEITQGLDDLDRMLADLRGTISREGWARFETIHAQVTRLGVAWHRDAMQDIEAGLGLDGILASGREILVSA